MKNMIVLLTTVVLIFGAVACAKDSGNIVTIPKDFKVIAIAGGVAPGSTVNKVEINADGKAVYYEISAGKKGEVVFVEKKRFKVEDPGLRHIYKMIKENNFFGLKKNYKSERVLDGNFAELTVTMDGKTHTVRTQNIEVKRFDEVMIAVNIATPGMKMVIYNEILR